MRFYAGVPQTGNYYISIRYQADDSGKITLGSGDSFSLIKSGTWLTAKSIVSLKDGVNTITLQNSGGVKTYIDCIMLESVNPIIENEEEDIVADSTTDSDPKTAVSDIMPKKDIKVWASSNNIYIENAVNSPFTIYDISGRKVASSTALLSYEEVTLNHSGLYIVRIQEKSYKVYVN